MTTIVVSLPHRQIATDSRNTDSGAAVFKCRKIERLRDGRIFLGSGHLFTIAAARSWAEYGYNEKYRPKESFEVLFGERADDFRFSCLIMKPDLTDIILLDDEMHPQPVFDEFLAIGSGGAYALGALKAGATPTRAIEIAIECDGASGGPVVVEDF